MKFCYTYKTRDTTEIATMQTQEIRKKMLNIRKKEEQTKRKLKRYEGQNILCNAQG